MISRTVDICATHIDSNDDGVQVPCSGEFGNDHHHYCHHQTSDNGIGVLVCERAYSLLQSLTCLPILPFIVLIASFTLSLRNYPCVLWSKRVLREKAIVQERGVREKERRNIILSVLVSHRSQISFANFLVSYLSHLLFHSSWVVLTHQRRAVMPVWM